MTMTAQPPRNAAALLGEATARLYPFQSRFFERDGIRMHYVDEGEGDPVVFVHGNPTWSFYFRVLIDALRDRYRCIAPDHVGCGLSDKPGEDVYEYTLGRRVEDLDALLESLDLGERITLVVHDWGGMIGTTWASRHADRIKRIVVLNTAAFHLPSSKPFPWQLWFARTRVGAALVRGVGAFSRAAVNVCTTRPLAPEVRQAYLAPYDSWDHRLAVLRFVQDIPLRQGDRAWDIVSEVETGLERFRKVPMLICWGLRDFVFDVHFLDEWRRRFPEAEVHAWADAGHFVLEDRPEDVVDRVEKFLERNPIVG